jgi:putative ABC transport system ATP-binding protein
MEKHMIELVDIHFSYPQSDFSLNIKELHIARGNKTAVIGPSGFGKTTLLNLLAGILLPDSGDIKVAGESLTHLPEKARRNFRIRNIGFVFQDFRLIPYLNILDNMLLPFRINSILSLEKSSRQSAIRLATELGLESKLKNYPAKLSHGERQRVAIGRALVHTPPVILADEPTGNLDPQNKEKIMEILFDYVQERQATLITVTHDMFMLKGFKQTIDFTHIQNSGL